MDILGFIIVLAGLGVAPRFGVPDAARASLAYAWERSRKAWYQAREQYVIHFAKPTFWAMGVSIAVQIAVLVGANWLMPAYVEDGTVQFTAGLPWLFINACALLITGEVFYLIYQWSALPTYRRDRNGQLMLFPDHLPRRQFLISEDGILMTDSGQLINEHGLFVDIAGKVLADGVAPVLNINADPASTQAPAIAQFLANCERVEVCLTPNGHMLNADGAYVNARGQLIANDWEVTTEAVQHPETGDQIVENEEGYRPGRFSFTKSFSLVLLTFTVIGLGVMWNAVQHQHSLTFIMGAACIYANLGLIRLFSEVVAWVVEKGTKLFEFIATVVSKEVLVALPGIKWTNIEQYLPKGVDILSEDVIGAGIRYLAGYVALQITPFILLVWMFTMPVVAQGVSAFLTAVLLSSIYFAKTGGPLQVQQMRYRFASLMFYVIPTLSVIASIFGALPAVQQMVHGQGHNLVGAVVEYGNGNAGIAIADWKSNLGSGFLYFVLACVLGTVAYSINPTEKSGTLTRWFGNLVAGLAMFCILAMFWCGYGLIKNVQGQRELRLPGTGQMASMGPKPSQTVATATVTAPTPPTAIERPTAPDAPIGATESGSPKPQKLAGAPPKSTRGQATPEFAAWYRSEFGQEP